MPELRKLTECHQFEESLNAAVPGTSYDTMCKTTPYTAGTTQCQSIRNCYNSGCCQTCQRIATETRGTICNCTGDQPGCTTWLSKVCMCFLCRIVPWCKWDAWFSLLGSRTDSLEAVRHWERQGQSAGHCRQAQIVSMKTTESFQLRVGKLSLCRMMNSPCGTGDKRSTFYLDSFTNGGSTIYSEVCSGPASFVISW